jgi:SSS family solute:Na+ symporter
MTTYFTAGGLLGSAWVNLVQLVVLVAGFALALPVALSQAGGVTALLASGPGPTFGSMWNGMTSASFLVLLVPAFLSSPGLLQKCFGAENARAVRLGVGWNGLVLLGFAFVPAFLGMAARVHHPGLPQELALPTLLAYDLPAGFGSLLLAAIFSAEISTADAVLFMLSTSLSQDLYRRFVRPNASDRQVLRIARWSAVGGGALGIALALVMPTIVGALSVFYAMLGATVCVPLIVALHSTTPRRMEVLISIATGATAVVIRQVAGGISPGTIWTPATVGIIAAVAGYAVAVTVRSRAIRPGAFI